MNPWAQKLVISLLHCISLKKSYSISLIFIVFLSPYSLTLSFNNVVEDSAFLYYPLTTGTKWIYHFVREDYYSGIEEFDFTREVLQDTILSDSLLYKKVKVVYPLHQRYEYFRIDTLTGVVESQLSEYPFNLPVPLYLIQGDTLFGFGGLTFEGWSSFEKWGISAPRKDYKFTNALNECCYFLIKGIGIDSFVTYYDFGEMTNTLKGVIINGMVYGDTSIIASSEDRIQLPEDFIVHQNYPNPFNPSTSIDYELKTGTRVKIAVYDILGNELVLLENEEKYPGIHSVKFDGSNFSSGIYFYKIYAADHVVVKKMILMK